MQQIFKRGLSASPFHCSPSLRQGTYPTTSAAAADPARAARFIHFDRLGRAAGHVDDAFMSRIHFFGLRLGARLVGTAATRHRCLFDIIDGRLIFGDASAAVDAYCTALRRVMVWPIFAEPRASSAAAHGDARPGRPRLRSTGIIRCARCAHGPAGAPPSSAGWRTTPRIAFRYRTALRYCLAVGAGLANTTIFFSCLADADTLRLHISFFSAHASGRSDGARPFAVIVAAFLSHRYYLLLHVLSRAPLFRDYSSHDEILAGEYRRRCLDAQVDMKSRASSIWPVGQVLIG